MSELDDLLDPGVRGSAPGEQKQIPNGTAVLVLGIISIVGCILYAIPGIVCGIISLTMFKKVKEIYATDPARYELSYKNAKAGQVCAIIGLSLSVLFFIYLLFVLFIVASMAPISRF